ncbi:MAG: 23S rRNA (pseudouridine(1915)-N(3))-methyltransferase RlmH [Oscillospiraceae bacterium]|nr:23S rRNA (pseudouridine(1915)-N(3))-methyltransferase RlmH [Oscillospiraceae bacterium]
MLNVKLICVGKMREKFYIDAFEEYRKRLQAYCRLELVEITEQRLNDRPAEKEITAALEREGQEILKTVPADAYLVALCVEGKQMPSEGMAELIAARENSGKPKLCFVIGGSFGLSPTVKARADKKLSMSRMTFPHHLARVMLIEQVYRGFKINEGSQYHK